ncbi:MAG TPA: DUF4097 family beta strand repeat-containing protein [Terriglobales bacterium]|nr:DUF4097 family beta strand repeat-containing protein [Terriglobales bacterium]
MLRELLIASTCALIAAAPAAADEWARTYPVTGHPTLVLKTDDADVHVATGPGRAVELKVTTVGWRIGPHGIYVEARQLGDRVECEVREPRVQFHIGFGFTRRSVRVDVLLPREVDLDVTSSDGRVALAPVTGSVRVRTSDGDIEAVGLRGDLHLQTSDGTIHARDLDGALEAHSSDGGIEVGGRFDRLDLSTSDGAIEADAGAGSRIETGWTLHSSDGSLTLRVPADLRADFDLRTGDGVIHLDLPVEVTGEIGRRELHGRLNGGGPLVQMRAADGSIRVEPS